MAMATPVIATSVGGVTEVVRDEVDGLVRAPCDPAGWSEATAALLSNPDLRATMGARARERALRDFSPEAHVRKVQSVYERVLAAAGA
jgi:glycosyltransferase involved in cell wall biosynthesis